MSEAADGSPVSFSLDGDVLTVRDEAGGGEMRLAVDEGATTTPATDAWFDVPVDDAVSLETSSLHFQNIVSVFLRGDEGTEYGKVTTEPFDIDSHGTFIDVSGVLKLLVYVERGSMSGRIVEEDGAPIDTVVSFDEPTRIVVGARSKHKRSVREMTVTDDPDDLMAAVSLLGSSIKEWSAERSWPTLRGHPPKIKLGDERRIPDGISVPDTGVTVGVPPEPASIFRVAPIAHYLGANVVPSDRAELRIGSSHVEPLGSGTDLETAVDELLARCLLLDSLVRIGGYYSLPREEYDELAPELPFYPPELYDEPIDRQLLEYLEVPFETLRPYVPDWPVTATIRPDAADIEVLPYIQNALGRVRVTDDGRPRTSESTAMTAHLSTGDPVATGVASVSPRSFERAIEWNDPPTERSSLLFVGAEEPRQNSFTPTVWERFRDDAPPTATYRRSLTTEELRSAFDAGHIYIHYDGRVDERGFVCSDGLVPFDDLPNASTGVLSVPQLDHEIAPGTALLDSVAVVAHSRERLSMEEAQRFGMLLSLGVSVATAADLVGISDRVRFVGDASRSFVSRACNSPPTEHRIEPIDDDRFRLTYRYQFTDADGLGEVCQLVPDWAEDSFQLAGTRFRHEEVLSRGEFDRKFAYDSVRIVEDGTGTDSVTTLPELDDLLSE